LLVRADREARELKATGEESGGGKANHYDISARDRQMAARRRTVIYELKLLGMPEISAAMIGGVKYHQQEKSGVGIIKA